MRESHSLDPGVDIKGSQNMADVITDSLDAEL